MRWMIVQKVEQLPFKILSLKLFWGAALTWWSRYKNITPGPTELRVLNMSVSFYQTHPWHQQSTRETATFPDFLGTAQVNTRQLQKPEWQNFLHCTNIELTFCHQQAVQFWLDQDFGSRSSRPPSCTRCWPHRWSFRAASSSPSCIGRSCERWLHRRLTWLLLEWPGWPAESRSRGPATQTPDSPFERTRTPFRQDPPLCAPETKKDLFK